MTRIKTEEIDTLMERTLALDREIREVRIAACRDRIVDLARVWATGFSGGSFNLIDAVRELEEAEK